MNQLDNPKFINSIDKDNLLANITDFPEQIEGAWNSVRKIALPSYYIQIKNIVVLGIGGSGIAGDLVGFFQKNIRLPISIYKDYELPGFVNSDTLVIVNSYSGNTEETSDGFYEALKRKAKVFIITTGGNLAIEARNRSIPYYLFDYQSQPRAAYVYGLICTLSLLERLGVFEFSPDHISEAIVLTQAWVKKLSPEMPTIQNPAKQLAEKLLDKIPVVVSQGVLSGVAKRWKMQFNENSKNAAYYEYLPEMAHYAVSGIEYPRKLNEKAYFIILQSKYVHPRTKIQENLLIQLFEKKHINYETIFAHPGGNILAELLILSLYGDFVSYYLAILNRVNPYQIPNQDFIKKNLTKTT